MIQTPNRPSQFDRCRALTLTEKVPTRFGNLYVHLDHDSRGNIFAVAFSTPGKFKDTQVGDAVEALAAAVTAMIAEIGGAS